jgi:hypothetical protein
VGDLILLQDWHPHTDNRAIGRRTCEEVLDDWLLGGDHLLIDRQIGSLRQG